MGDRVSISFAQKRSEADRKMFGGPSVDESVVLFHQWGGEADLRVIQELMGHETPVTTGIYTKLTKIEARKAYFSYHPRANIET